jgi:PKD repeat protein
MKKAIFLLLICSIFQISFGQSKARKALFIGNSYTFYNDMPDLVRRCALSVNDTLETDQNTISGYTWKQHAGDATTNNKIKQGGFNHIILQANSLEFTYDNATVNTNTIPYGKYLDSLAHKHNPCAKVILYNTWGRKNGSNGQTYLEQDLLIENRYKSFADLKEAMISPAGPVRRYLRTNHPEIELYVADESHPSEAGSYVSAICFYTAIFRKDPTLITYNFNLSAATANAIKQAVKVVLYNDLASWNVGKFDAPEPLSNFTIASNTETMISIDNISQNANEFLWKFGDNTISNTTSPSHTYANNGTYTVTLTASYCKQSSSLSKSVTVATVKPIITNVEQSPKYVFPNETVTVSSSITDDVGVINAVLYWGTNPGDETYSIDMNVNGSNYSAVIPAQQPGAIIYYHIKAMDGNSNISQSEEYNYKVQEVIITISPSAITLNKNAQQQFTATATDLNGNPVAFTPVWSSSAGSITSLGMFTAPSSQGIYFITATQAGVNGTGLAEVTVSSVPVIEGKIESEKYSDMFGIQTETTSDAGGGLNVAYIGVNDWMTYEVNVLKTGIYKVEFRIASTISNASLELFSGVTSLGVLMVPNSTGGWQNWQTHTMNVYLVKGIQTIKLLAKTAGFNINYMNFIEEDVALGLDNTHSPSSKNIKLYSEIFPNPFSNNTRINFLSSDEKLIQLFTLEGFIVKEFTLTDNFLEIGDDLHPGIYIIVVYERDKMKSIKIVKN